MKKIITAAIIIAFGINSNAQGNDKDFRFGLKIEPSFNWLSPDKRRNLSLVELRWGLGLEQ